MRQVSFTLLMTGHCDSNPAQYERNRRFGHLVHVLGRETSGAKLPSVGLRLNASKSESRLSTAMISVHLQRLKVTLESGSIAAVVVIPNSRTPRLTWERKSDAKRTGDRRSLSLVFVSTAAVSNRLKTT